MSSEVFVGRSRELEQLDAWLHSDLRLLFLVGPAGIGKTALAGRFVARASKRMPTAFYPAWSPRPRPTLAGVGLCVVDDIDSPQAGKNRLFETLEKSYRDGRTHLLLVGRSGPQAIPTGLLSGVYSVMTLGGIGYEDSLGMLEQTVQGGYLSKQTRELVISWAEGFPAVLKALAAQLDSREPTEDTARRLLKIAVDMSTIEGDSSADTVGRRSAALAGMNLLDVGGVDLLLNALAAATPENRESEQLLQVLWLANALLQYGSRESCRRMLSSVRVSSLAARSSAAARDWYLSAVDNLSSLERDRLDIRADDYRRASLSSERSRIVASDGRILNTPEQDDAGLRALSRQYFDTLLRRSESPQAIAALARRLSAALLEQGALSRGIEVLEQALEYVRSAVDATISTELEGDLGAAWLLADDPVRALPFLERALVAARDLKGTHPDVAQAMVNLAAAEVRIGDLQRACQLYEEAIALFRRALGPGNLRAIATEGLLAGAWLEMGRTDDALELVSSAIRRGDSVLSSDPVLALSLARTMAVGYRNLGEVDLAKKALVAQITMARKLLPEDDPSLLAARSDLTALERRRGDSTRASRSDGRSPLLPVYILCDTSGSMSGARIEGLNTALEALHRSLRLNPHSADRTMVSLISFNEKAELVVPLSHVSQQWPALTARGGTNLGSALLLLRNRIISDVRDLKSQGFTVFRPTAFVITDGLPSDSVWPIRRDELLSIKERPRIIAYGVGDVDAAFLSRLASDRAFISKAGDWSDPDLFHQLAEAIASSVAASGGSEERAVFSSPDVIPGFVSIDPGEVSHFGDQRLHP